MGALAPIGYTTRHARQDRVFEQDAWLSGRDTNLFPNKDVFEPVRARPTLETEDRRRLTVTSGYAVANGVATAVSFQKNYTDVMPSVNVKADLSDTLVARVAVSRAISRPNLGDIAPGLILATGINNGSGGNPNLDPFRSVNYDVSVERCFNRFGKLSVAGFIRDFDSYETAQTTLINIPDSKFGAYNITTVVNGARPNSAGSNSATSRNSTSCPAFSMAWAPRPATPMRSRTRPSKPAIGSSPTASSASRPPTTTSSPSMKKARSPRASDTSGATTTWPA